MELFWLEKTSRVIKSNHQMQRRKEFCVYRQKIQLCQMLYKYTVKGILIMTLLSLSKGGGISGTFLFNSRSRSAPTEQDSDMCLLKSKLVKGDTFLN